LATIQHLQRKIYANARAIYSPLGGGNNGHLALVMRDADYLAQTTLPFAIPIHPGDLPIHAAGATNAQITDTNRLYDHRLIQHALYRSVIEELRKQLLAAIPNMYLHTLEDPNFGFLDSTPQILLAHLHTNYGDLTPEEIEDNRASLARPWNPDDPIEDLWSRITDAQRFANRASEAIPDAAAIRLSLAIIEDTGVFTNAIDKWRDKPIADQTLANFRLHFAKENQERLRKLTARTAGYHGANHAATQPNTAVTELAAAAQPAPTPSAAVKLTNGTMMYYCWTHGLGKNRNHTSANCHNKDKDHKDAATADNLLGGNDRIMSGGRPRRSET
jgi:hypothetical protein